MYTIHKIQRKFETETQKRTGNTAETWRAAQLHFEGFTRTKIAIQNEDKSGRTKIATGFRDYLLRKCAHNSASTYFAKFKAVCHQLFEEGMETFTIPSISQIETHREHLSHEEVKLLVKTPCKSETLRKMALFSILTGLRWSDIEKLRWCDIRKSNSGWVIEHRQQKTRSIEILPISENAIQILGDSGDRSPQAKIFDIIYSSRVSEVLKKWCSDAGIDRKITFHCFRHTNAVLQLEAGTDIFTLSKMLGHRDIKTTQIYAKISDKAKREAAERIAIF
jgi:integrase